MRNVGASPFYYRWPVSAALLRGREVVYTADFDADIRTWMPGDKWDFEARAYAEPAQLYHEEQVFDLTGVPDGVYTLALTIQDPSCGKPGRGGRPHPMEKAVREALYALPMAPRLALRLSSGEPPPTQRLELLRRRAHRNQRIATLKNKDRERKNSLSFHI